MTRTVTTNAKARSTDAVAVPASAVAWASAVNELWRPADAMELLAAAYLDGALAGVPIYRERFRTSEDESTVLFSADFAWTLLYDFKLAGWRAL